MIIEFKIKYRIYKKLIKKVKKFLKNINFYS